MLKIIHLILSIINENPGVITLLVGCFAIGLYIRQKNDRKREIAKSIIQEIGYAERQIKIARERNNVFLLTNALLPTNNWYCNIVLFINDLEQIDRDSISDFYAKVSFLDKVIASIMQFKVNQIIPKSVPRTIISKEPSEHQNSSSPQDGDSSIQEFQLSAEVILKSISSQVEFLYNTPAANKLREISIKKWYQIL